MNLYMIGYEGLNQTEFFRLLNLSSIKTLIDIRELPLSRKAGFSKNQLLKTASLNNIDYIHKSSLGCPRDIRHAYRNNGNWLDYSVNFFSYLCTQQKALQELSEIVSRNNSCLMCFEADYFKCHRSYVSLMLEKRFLSGLIVKDLRSIKASWAEETFVEDIQAQLLTIDLEIDALCP